MSISLKSIGLIAALLLTGVLLSGCNTIDGIGEDIEAAGDGIEKAAERNKID